MEDIMTYTSYSKMSSYYDNPVANIAEGCTVLPILSKGSSMADYGVLLGRKVSHILSCDIMRWGWQVYFHITISSQTIPRKLSGIYF